MRNKNNICFIEKININNPYKFTIEGSSKAFSIIIDKLYSNRVRAVIRELCTNAWDAHVEAGKQDTPFEVKLPTILDDTFYVKDFGTGIHPDKIYYIYGTAFHSTRDYTDDFVGAFGIGRLSALIMSDSFVLENRYDGIQYDYSVFLDSDGIPSIVLLTQNETEECNGLTVKFSVPRHETTNFLTECKRVCRWFDTKPKVVGYDDFLSYSEPMISLDNFEIYRGNYGYQSPKIIMGNVEYPVNMDSFLNDEFSFKQQDIYIRVPIGTVDITPSREQLNYNDETIENIRSIFTEVDEKLGKHLSELIEDCNSLWEARIEAIKLCSKRLLSRSRLRILEWNNQKILEGSDYYGNIDLYRYPERIDNKELFEVRQYELSYSNTRRLNSYVQQVIGIRDYYIFFKDINSQFRDRIKKFLEDNRNQSPPNYLNQGCYLLVDKTEDGSGKQAFIDLLGLPDGYIRNVSELERPSRESVSRNTTNYQGKVLLLNEGVSRFQNLDRFWTNEFEISPNEKKFYVELNRYKGMDGYKSYTPIGLRKFIEFLRQSGYYISRLYGVKTRYLKTVKKNGGWTNFFDFLESKIKEVKKQYDLIYHYRCSKLADKLRREYKLVNLFEIDNRFTKKLFEQYKIIERSRTKSRFTELFKTVCTTFNRTKLDDKVFQNYSWDYVNKLNKYIEDRYPLFACIQSFKDKSDEVKDYLDFIESKYHDGEDINGDVKEFFEKLIKGDEDEF